MMVVERTIGETNAHGGALAKAEEATEEFGDGGRRLALGLESLPPLALLGLQHFKLPFVLLQLCVHKLIYPVIIITTTTTTIVVSTTRYAPHARVTTESLPWEVEALLAVSFSPALFSFDPPAQSSRTPPALDIDRHRRRVPVALIGHGARHPRVVLLPCGRCR